MTRTRTNSLAMMAVAAASVGGMVSSAMAIDLTYTGIQSLGTYSISMPSNAEKHVFAGRMSFSVTSSSDPRFATGSSIFTFCSDLEQVAIGSPRTYEFYSNQDDTPAGDRGIDDLPTPGSPPMGMEKAQAVSALYQSRFFEATTGGAMMASAFQLALWEIVFEPNAAGGGLGTLDLSSGAGSFRVTQGDASARSLAQTWLDEIAGLNLGPVSDQLIGFGSSVAQDQITLIAIPLPGAAAMAVIGLFGGAVARRRFRG